MELKNKEETEMRFNELWREFEPYIRKLCKYKLSSMPHCIDDCFQETFKALATAMKSGTVIEHPKTWLSTVANNKIKDMYKESKKEAGMIIPLSHEDALNYSSHSDEIDSIFYISDEQIDVIKEDVLKQLTDEERQLIDEYYVQNVKLKLIAQNHQYTESKMKKVMFNLRKKIISLSNSALKRQDAQNGK